LNGVYAVIYPVPKTFINSLFGSETVVFLKYTTHEVISDNLESCEKVIFYESKGEKKLVGEGIINKMELLTVDKILEKYRKDLFLTEDELRSYSKNRNKKPIVFTLKNPYRYDKGIKSEEPITMGGKYITKKEYENMLNEV